MEVTRQHAVNATIRQSYHRRIWVDSKVTKRAVTISFGTRAGIKISGDLTAMLY